MRFRAALAESSRTFRRRPALLLFPMAMSTLLLGGSLGLALAGPAWLKTAPLALSLILWIPAAAITAGFESALILGVQRTRSGHVRLAALVPRVAASFGNVFRLRLAIGLLGQASALIYVGVAALHNVGVALWVLGLAGAVCALPLAVTQVTFVAWSTAALRIAVLEHQDAKTSAALAWRFLHGRVAESLRFVLGTTRDPSSASGLRSSRTAPFARASRSPPPRSSASRRPASTLPPWVAAQLGSRRSTCPTNGPPVR